MCNNHYCCGVERIVTFAAVLLTALTIYAGEYRTAVFSEEIKTLQVLVNGEQLSRPVIELGSADRIDITFDELSYENSTFYYKIIHCNADWTESDLSSMEYLDGFDRNVIGTYDYSVSTTVNYIHYTLSLPNEDVRPTLSGNYAVLIARDNDFDAGLVACACFSVVEPLASFAVNVTGATMLELNGRYQQLDIEVRVDEVASRQPVTDFILVVSQNGRADSRRHITTPTYISGSTLQYKNSRQLIFEAGNQYRSIDFSSRYTYGAGIDHIAYTDDAYHVVLQPAAERTTTMDAYHHDVHGDYIINLQSNAYPETEADYMWVHFTYPRPYPYIEGRMYLLGALNPDGATEMLYDLENKTYHGTLLLKQGGYNYIFALRPKSGGEMTLLHTEGGFWQTSNRYELYLYYRPFGARYDRMVGYYTNQ